MKLARPRHSGPREAAGRIQRGLEDRTSPANAQRVLDLARRKAVDPRLGSPLGVLFVLNAITAVMYDAGSKFATLRNAADRVSECPPRSAKAIDLVGATPRRRAGDDPDRDEEILMAYANARFALTVDQLRAVEYVACDQRQLSDYRQRLDLFHGLRKLCEHWRLE